MFGQLELLLPVDDLDEATGKQRHQVEALGFQRVVHDRALRASHGNASTQDIGRLENAGQAERRFAAVQAG